MGIPNAGPWGTLSNMITKKIGDARAKATAMKDQQTQATWKAWDGIMQNPNSTPEERDRARDEMKKLVPKDSVPIVEGYHKMVNALHGHKQVKEASGGGAGGGQAQAQPASQPAAQPAAQPSPGTPQPPGTSGGGAPNPALATPNAAPAVPPSLGKMMSDVASPERTGAAEGAQAKAKAQAMTGAPDPIKDREIALADHEHELNSPSRLIEDMRKTGMFTEAEIKDKMAEKITGKPVTGKEPKPLFGPGGQFRGIEDPLNNKTILSRESIPAGRADLQKMWDDAKGEERASDKKQEDKENRQLARTITTQTTAFENALKRKAYGDAITQVTKAKTNFQDSIDRMKTMDDNLRDIATAKQQGKENQQAMLSLLANHVGMTSGAQPKMRMSKAQWDEAKDSVPYLARVEAHFDSEGYLSGVVLTPDQMDQMVGLAHDKVGILQEHVRRLEDDPDYKEAQASRSAVPPGMKSPGKKSKGTGGGKKIVVSAEDMQGVQ